MPSRAFPPPEGPHAVHTLPRGGWLVDSFLLRPLGWFGFSGWALESPSVLSLGRPEHTGWAAPHCSLPENIWWSGWVETLYACVPSGEDPATRATPEWRCWRSALVRDGVVAPTVRRRVHEHGVHLFGPPALHVPSRRWAAAVIRQMRAGQLPTASHPDDPTRTLVGAVLDLLAAAPQRAYDPHRGRLWLTLSALCAANAPWTDRDQVLLAALQRRASVDPCLVAPPVVRCHADRAALTAAAPPAISAPRVRRL